jgi:hypothetical protein
MTRRLTAWALAALPAAACLATPTYQPQVKVSYTEDASGPTAGATVTGLGFALHFAGGTGFHFPDKLTVDDTQVLGNDTSAACFDPNEAGIQLSPSSRISGDTAAMIADPMVKNQIQPVLRGPAVVQVKLDWANPLCNATRRPGGTSTFTAFLDGRIVRHDRLDDATTADPNAGDCTCTDAASPGEFNVSSYWTFDRAVLSAAPSAVYTSPGSDPQDLMMQPTRSLPPEIDGQVFACFGVSAYQVASALRVPGGTDPHLFMLRDSAALFTLVHYGVLSNTHLGDVALDSHSAVFIERNDCMAAFRRAQEYLAEPLPALTINGTPAMLSENDGIYGGDRGDGQAPGVVLSTDRATISGTVPGSFAVWLSFPHAVDLVRATRSPAGTGAWYVPQQIDGRTWIVWFRDPLVDATQTIVIEPY